MSQSKGITNFIYPFPIMEMHINRYTHNIMSDKHVIRMCTQIYEQLMTSKNAIIFLNVI